MTRLERAIMDGEVRFWSALADEFGEVETGDFPPDAAQRLTDAMAEAARLWLVLNADHSSIADDEAS